MKAIIVIIAGLMGLSSIGPARAQQPAVPLPSFDLTKFTCAELMVEEEEQAGYILVLLYGFVAGKERVEVHTPGEIETRLRQTYTYCQTAPASTVMTAFQKAGLD